eukprot:scaffold27152_cov65-Phaeocystis_antarctica.AAC.2
MPAREEACVHACSRGSLRSEVDAIQDVGERHERAATLSWRRVRLDEVVEPRCVLRLMQEATGAGPDARAMMAEETTARMRSYSRDLGPEPATPRTCAEPKDDRRFATGKRAAVQAARASRAHRPDLARTRHACCRAPPRGHRARWIHLRASKPGDFGRHRPAAVWHQARISRGVPLPGLYLLVVEEFVGRMRLSSSRPAACQKALDW